MPSFTRSIHVALGAAPRPDHPAGPSAPLAVVSGAWLVLPLLCCPGLACQPASRPRPADAHTAAPQPTSAPKQAALAPSVAPHSSPAVGVSSDGAAEPGPVAPPEPASPAGEAPEPEPEPSEAPPEYQLEVQVSESPPDDPDRAMLASYDRRGGARPRGHVQVHTDRNSAEFPRSVTSARIRYVADPVAVTGPKARAMQVALRLQTQRAAFAGCDATTGSTDGCGCEDLEPYAYVALVHELPADTRLDQSRHLSFWARSKDAFDLHLKLVCFIQPRPPFAYLDAERRRMDPCWHSERSELKLPAPVGLLGDDRWHRYQVRIDDLPTEDPAEGLACLLGQVTQIAYVLEKRGTPEPGAVVQDKAVVSFDDLEAVGTP